jgi:3-dehydroquinate synthase
MRDVTVHLDQRSYPIRIGTDILRQVGPWVSQVCPARNGAIVTDENVGPLYANAVCESMRSAGYACDVITVPAGESSKSLNQAGEVYNLLADKSIERGSPLIALGGGVVGDLTGFVAATWVRGVPFVQVPTTFEADVDASVGGKTGVNHPAGKNMIGAFYQPQMVLIDTGCISSLSDRDLRAGLAESIKHAVIRDADFFGWHEQHLAAILDRQPVLLEDIIAKNVAIKAAVVGEDERETTGVRAHLNFGHTIGHAIEALLGYELRHGECIALGMIATARMAVSLGMLRPEAAHRLAALIQAANLPTQMPEPLPVEKLWQFMQHDKKVADGKIGWILPDRIGRVVRRNDVPKDVVLEALSAIAP